MAKELRSKIDVGDFRQSQMVARLLIIQRDWSKQSDEIVLNKTKATAYVKNVVKENFIYPADKLEKITGQLLLFLYGSKNNIFSIAIIG
jgi:hypothetical protein